MDNSNTIETQITKRILREICDFTNSPSPIAVLKNSDYKRLFAQIYAILDQLGLNEKYRSDYSAIGVYQKRMRKMYQHRVDSLQEHFPNGIFTKNSNGDLIGIDEMISKMIRELTEMERMQMEDVRIGPERPMCVPQTVLETKKEFDKKAYYLKKAESILRDAHKEDGWAKYLSSWIDNTGMDLETMARYYEKCDKNDWTMDRKIELLNRTANLHRLKVSKEENLKQKSSYPGIRFLWNFFK